MSGITRNPFGQEAYTTDQPAVTPTAVPNIYTDSAGRLAYTLVLDQGSASAKSGIYIDGAGREIYWPNLGNAIATIDNTPSNSSLTGSQVSGFVSAANALAARINALYPTVTLGTLTLSGSLQIGTAASGTISGASTGSTIASNIPGITVNSSARTYSGTPTGSAQTIANGLVETLAGATGSPKSSSIVVGAASVALGTLTLSGTLQIGTAASGTISGATAGSSIASNIPGVTVNSGARTYSGTPTGSAATISNGLVETLAGATGSPKSSSVTVAAAAAIVTMDPSTYTAGTFPSDKLSFSGGTAAIVANGTFGGSNLLGFSGSVNLSVNASAGHVGAWRLTFQVAWPSSGTMFVGPGADVEQSSFLYGAAGNTIWWRDAGSNINPGISAITPGWYEINCPDPSAGNLEVRQWALTGSRPSSATTTHSFGRDLSGLLTFRIGDNFLIGTIIYNPAP